MSLYGLMRTAISGMMAQSNRLGTIADNIANSNTTGYKRASSEFASLIINSSPDNYTSGGVLTYIRNSIAEQGGLLASNSVTDLAIMGAGFFVVTDADGTQFLTRAGSFVPDSDGNLVNASGFYLMGFAVNGGAPGSALENINLSNLAMRADATTSGTLKTNLPSDADIVDAAHLPSTNSADAVYTAKTSLVTYDNLGKKVTLDVYSTKTADGTWEISVYNQADATNGGFPYASGPLSTTTLTFDDTGQLAAGSPTSLGIAIPGGKTMTLDLSGTTQLASGYTVIDAHANGNPPSNVEHVEISTDGTLYAVYGNGSRIAAFKIPLAGVPSPDSLDQVTGNVFATSPNSGEIQIGDAGKGGLGSIVSGALEQSTVDIATELTNMIDAQRGYTANSKVFQTGAELMDVLVNLKR